jgi:hypothetical protein
LHYFRRMAEKSQKCEPQQPDTNLRQVQRPGSSIAEPLPAVELVPQPDAISTPEWPFSPSLEDAWRARIERTRSTMVAIPQDPEGRAKVKDEILVRAREFLRRHEGHVVSHFRSFVEHQSLSTFCESCQETMTIVFEYPKKQQRRPSDQDSPSARSGSLIGVPFQQSD